MGVHAFEGGWRGYVVAPIWRDNVQGGGKSSLGARLRTRKVTAQGRFAACAFVDFSLWIGRPWNCWGAAPSPARDAVP